MSTFLLAVLKYALIVVIWIFFLFALRAVWRETRRTLRTQVEPPRPLVAEPARPSGAAMSAGVPSAADRSERPGSSSGQVVLLAVAGPLEGRRIELATPVVIGRDASCSLVIPEDRYVSARHAEIDRDGRRLLVRDLGSTNGTYVDGERVEDVMRVNRGDIVQVGQSMFRVVR
jgi:hypothetical protein